jgi:hypothetical protein
MILSPLSTQLVLLWHLLFEFVNLRDSLVNRPYVSLWLGKTYVLPAGMYAGQVWGTEINLKG